MGKALLVIDVQNDYFPGGAFPLWNAEGVLTATTRAIGAARAQGIPVILIQHLADPARGRAPFFNEGTGGAELHADILAAAPGALILHKRHADAFEGTGLGAALASLGVTELLVCGMMTQNCVTHTAISKAAEAYGVTLLTDCCTTVSELLHAIALNAVSLRVGLVASTEAL